jgi:hypothetical protein
MREYLGLPKKILKVFRLMIEITLELLRTGLLKYHLQQLH